MLFCFALHHGQSPSQKRNCTGLFVKLLASEVIISMGHQVLDPVLDKSVHIFRLDADPANWMDGGSWEGTMSDLLWDEDGEMYRCSPRPASWHPPSKMTGRQSHDSLLSLKRLVICSKQWECLTSHSHSAAVSLALTCNNVLLVQPSGCFLECKLE